MVVMAMTKTKATSAFRMDNFQNHYILTIFQNSTTISIKEQYVQKSMCGTR